MMTNLPIVKEIQICGSKITQNLEDACIDYLRCLATGTDREKLSFSILLPDGTHRHITIRQMNDEVVAYGDFDGLPDALEFSQIIQGVKIDEP